MFVHSCSKAITNMLR